MNIRIDTHTHSLASGHAYSTIDEFAKGARRRGLSGFVLTDHGPSMPGTTHPYHFGNLRILPKRIHGVRFYTGIEANIIDDSGGLDLAGYLLARLDFVLAGLHDICMEPGSLIQNTKAMVAAIANPMVDAISHPGNPSYPVDFIELVDTACAYGKALEINNSSFRIRTGSEATCSRMAALCAEKGALVVCASDAHYWSDVGNVSIALSLIKKAGIARDKVINASVACFESFIAARKKVRSEAAAKA
ncbi:MAG: phosphatase [Spirochaetia bacterium]|nr:phosphatase [Spirochaetia bacterium]